VNGYPLFLSCGGVGNKASAYFGDGRLAGRYFFQKKPKITLSVD